MAVAGRRDAGVLLLGLLGLAGCAAAVPRGEYQGDVFRHWSPAYSFKVPGGWRRATVADAGSFGWNRAPLERVNEETRLNLLRAAANAIEQFDAVLISERGGWLSVRAAPSQGFRLSSGYRPSEQEKQAAWESMKPKILKELFSSVGDVDKVPETMRPRLALDALDVVDYGPYTTLRLRFRSFDPISGTGVWSFVSFFGSMHAVGVTHVGIPDDPDEGRAGFEELVRSFRFE